jgi:hypothetical protein
VITPESAERGDYADLGFLDSGNNRRSAFELWGERAAALKVDCALTLREALAAFGYQYGRFGVESEFPSFRQVDGAVDYRTGAEVRLALHLPNGANRATFERVRRLIEGVA